MLDMITFGATMLAILLGVGRAIEMESMHRVYSKMGKKSGVARRKKTSGQSMQSKGNLGKADKAVVFYGDMRREVCGG